MGRTGRKPNPHAKRRQTTRAGQGRDRPPVDMLRHRIEEAGICPLPVLGDENVMSMAKRLGLLSMATDYPLDVLAALGKLGEDGHVRASAGARFADLYRRVYGAPTAPAASLGYRAPDHDAPGRRTLLTEVERAEVDAKQFRKAMSAMERRGKHVAAVTILVAVHCHAPRPAQMDALVAGLDALCGVS